MVKTDYQMSNNSNWGSTFENKCKNSPFTKFKWQTESFTQEYIDQLICDWKKKPEMS